MQELHWLPTAPDPASGETWVQGLADLLQDLASLTAPGELARERGARFVRRHKE
jgi:hypothetical protein